ncbi:hypothetical protein E1B28_004146 [Marasmius oreades]|uniref:Uncharacterized protein n=1 Tax=Marasmius oreades TaxID=181124 RepID=A0A9P8ACS3_9AGAR|nr:uncharacterized protein E1B28_004146 [Marasmius oreades]KAG7096733.1 hypothetical protein E1B28_004146 [Marasmius oreades]
MDDDLTFGTSVWGSTEPVDLLASNSKSSEDTTSQRTDGDEFDDFDDFGSPETGNIPVDDDDFGDFGDADESTQPVDFKEEMAYPEIPIAGPSRIDWEPLHLHPFPDRKMLTDQVNAILEPVWSSCSISHYTTKEGIRDVEGVNQILVTNESRGLHAMLVQSPPPTKPSNWIRSRIRRQHLIALGIPVNLDEVLPQAGGKPLPPLQITTRPMSAPPGPRNARNSTSTPASQNNSRAGSPHSNAKLSQFGPKPCLDDDKIKELLEIDPENLKLQPLSVIERHFANVRSQTAQTNALLTYLLQTRESLQQDSETYNGLIAELIGEAQKNKAGKSRTAARRGTGMT